MVRVGSALLGRVEGSESFGLKKVGYLETKVVEICKNLPYTKGAKETIIALERGAFDFVTKPENYLDAKEEHFKTSK